MVSEVIDTDRGLDELLATLKTLQDSGSYVKVGVLGSAAGELHPDGEHTASTNVEIALTQEFGSEAANIPARPFIGSTFELNRSKYQGMLAKGLEKLYENKLSAERLLGLIGLQMERDIKERVTSRDNNFAPNAPATIEKKMRKSRPEGFIGPLESPRPLLDTGRLVASVAHEVVLTDDEQVKGYSGPGEG